MEPILPDRILPISSSEQKYISASPRTSGSSATPSSQSKTSHTNTAEPITRDLREAREKKETWKKKEAKESITKKVEIQASVSGIAKGPPGLQRLRPPPYKLQDFNAAPRLPTFTSVQTESLSDGRTLELCLLTDIPFNKRGFRYLPCQATPQMPQIMYREIDLPPHGARINWHDMSQFLELDRTGMVVSTQKGFRTAKANISVREGSWYSEYKIERGGGHQGAHVRLGFARREAPLDAPVGGDGYSYGLRDLNGQKVHLSRPKKFMTSGFATGDVIGLHIYLPPSQNSLSPSPSLYNIFRDRIPIRYKGQLYFEQTDYLATKDMEDIMNPVIPPPLPSGHPAPSNKPTVQILKGSYINVYKNGVFQGTAFEDLYSFYPPHSKIKGHDLDDGTLGYFPAVSVFKGGIVRLNFGPTFEFPPKEIFTMADGIAPKPMCERYDQIIAEDYVWDMLDEIEWWEEGGDVESTVAGGLGMFNMGNVETVEIKELRDDDINYGQFL